MITLSSVALALNELNEPNEDESSETSPVSQGFSSAAEASPREARATGRARVIPFSRSRRPDRMPKLTDRDLVDRARAGDQEAFGQLVRRHQPRIHRLALHMLRDRGDAEDVAQEAFIRAFRALDRFDGRSEPYTWFYRIAVNLSLNVIRSRRSRGRGTGGASLDAVDPDDPRMEAWMASAATGPGAPAVLGGGDAATLASRKELYATLCAGIDALSDTLRTTLILVCVDGRSHEEASKVLGAPEGTIAWRVHEARRKLREHLSTRGFDPEGEGD